MRHRTVCLLLSTIVFATLVAPAAAAAAADARGSQGGFLARPKGLAYGAAGRLHHADLPDVTIGRVAPQTLPCNPVDGHVYERRVATVEVDPPDLPSLLSNALVVDKGHVDFDEAADRADVFESSKVDRLTMLGGAIRARAVLAEAHAGLGAAGFDVAGQVRFVDLTINGTAIAATVPPNTRVDLDGMGYVVLNEQRRTGDGTTSRGIDVTAIRVHLDDAAGYAGDVEVAHAEAVLTRQPGGGGGRIGGYAYVASATARPVLTLHPQGTIAMPCAGTGGRVVERVVGAVEQAPVVASETGRTTVMGSITESLVESETSATVEDLVALDGAVRADAVAVTASSRGTPEGTESHGTFEFVNLVIGGEPVSGEVAPDTTVRLRGFGNVQLNRQVCDSDAADPTSCQGDDASAVTVTGIRIVIRVADNPLDLPVGAVVNVAVARSEVVA